MSEKILPCVVEALNTSVEVSCKRLYLPFVVKSTCPECGEVASVSLDCEEYLSYPDIGEVYEMPFYCPECDENDKATDWYVHLRFGVTLEPV